jgi:shikimate kinase
LLLPFFYTGAVSNEAPIYLVGMMGVGKSTVGATLASTLARAFVDTDHEVERVAGRSVAEIFATDGEARFRELEAETIAATTEGSSVVSLGGGAICQPGAVERLLAAGQVVFLVADPETLIARIADPSSRPLLAGLDLRGQTENLRVLLAEREPFYRQATFRVDARGTADEVVARVVDMLADGTK